MLVTPALGRQRQADPWFTGPPAEPTWRVPGQWETLSSSHDYKPLYCHLVPPHSFQSSVECLPKFLGSEEDRRASFMVEGVTVSLLCPVTPTPGRLLVI